MARWMPALAILCFVMMDFIVCPPVTDKPPLSTPPPDADEEVVSAQFVSIYAKNFLLIAVANDHRLFVQ